MESYPVPFCAAVRALAVQDSTKPAATVNGQPIYDGHLMSAAGTKLLELRNQEYKVESDALDKLVLKKLIEAEARKRGLAAEQLLEQEVDSKISEPSDDEARGYFLAGRNEGTLPFDQIKQQVKKASERLSWPAPWGIPPAGPVTGSFSAEPTPCSNNSPSLAPTTRSTDSCANTSLPMS